jgi:penicillin-binding protein 1B
MPARKKKARPKRRGWLKPALAALTLGALVALGWVLWPFWHLSGQFAGRIVQQPSRLYGAPTVLVVGDPGSAVRLRRALESAGYASSVGRRPAPGQFRAAEDKLEIHLRRTPTGEGWREAGLAIVAFEGGAIRELRWNEAPASRVALEAPLVGSFYGPDRRERRPVRLDDLPEHLTRAVLAAEDKTFFAHPGISFRGVLRALWVNLRTWSFRQGGSTLTQQLVKNLFLTHERKLSRKLREVPLALLVDWRYSKPAILNAYLNEIYWGRRDGVDLMGVGAAAEAYFGKEASRLTLCEATVLAGMIPSPGSYDPGRHPEAARARRDWVLEQMHEQEWLDDARLASAREEALCYGPSRARPLTGAEYFREAARSEVERRFGVGNLADAGFTILSTLRPADQAAAEEAVAWGVEALEEGWEKGRSKDAPLQAALVSIEPASGAVTAYVGGRDYAASQFDRAGQAKRQAGSAFKPVVYAAAFEQGVTMPAGLLDDEALTVEVAGSGTWEPQNDDRVFRGKVSARRALEESLNVPTARLAIDTGLDEVGGMASLLGLGRMLPRVHSMALGALEVTPLELATVYATLAAGGVRHEPHFVSAVLAPSGESVSGRPLVPPRPVISPASAYLVTSVLEGVFDRGTAKVVRQWGMVDRLAGKTGTSNDRRDSWFAGYAPSRATLVWVGYDDNRATRLSGSRAALPIWNRFTWRLRPPGGYMPASPPSEVTTATIDPLSGELATDRCREVVTEYFPRDRVPTALCYLHAEPWQLRAQARGEEAIREGRFKRWFKRVFKGKKSDPPEPL